MLLTCLKQEVGAALAPVSFRYFSQLKCPAENRQLVGLYDESQYRTCNILTDVCGRLLGD